jgi:putative PIN family toxin of toxin-antitoxin system
MPPSPSAPVRLVLDTNVVLDCTIFGDATVTPLVALLDARAAVALVRDDALDELTRVLRYPQFALAPEAQAAAMTRYLAWTERVTATGGAKAPLPACRDRDDQKFLEIARDGAAHWLVTRDKALLVLARRRAKRTDFTIVDPPRLCAALSAEAVVRAAA